MGGMSEAFLFDIDDDRHDPSPLKIADDRAVAVERGKVEN
jgi:hypothetical protein